jgi:hypothetical protein
VAEKKNDERTYITYASPETVGQHFLFLTGQTMRTAKLDSLILQRILRETKWK